MRIAHAKVPKIETARETLATFGPLSLNFPSQYRAPSPQRKVYVAITTMPLFYGLFLPDLGASPIASALGSGSYAERLIGSYRSHAF
jgi:hypothetical protein